MNIDLLVLYVGNFREWSTFINYQKSSQQPPATPSNPQQPIQQPYVKRTSDNHPRYG